MHMRVKVKGAMECRGASEGGNAAPIVRARSRMGGSARVSTRVQCVSSPSSSMTDLQHPQQVV